MLRKPRTRTGQTLITVTVSGGLGNQLFQAAAALALADRHGTGVRLDLGKFRRLAGPSEDPASRPPRLDAFLLPGVELCPEHESRRARLRWNVARTLHLPPSLLGFRVDAHVYDASFHHLPDGTWLRGYFQSEHYFAKAADRIRTAFAPKDDALRARVAATLESLRRPSRPLVSLHVRRGDFLGLSDRDCLTPDRFLDDARALFPGSDFIVFSDDPGWCRATLEDDVTRVSPFARVVEDLVAMTLCDHNIVAKSTFSWWGAWLNATPGRRVVAPAIARRHPPAWAGEGPDYYPAGWTVLESGLSRDAAAK